MHELPHNHSRNPRHAHPLPCVNPYINTCNNFGPFPDILNTAEVFSSRFFSFRLFDQILLLPIYNTPKSKANHTLFFSLPYKPNHLTFLLSPHSPLPSLPQPASKPPPHLISLPPQNPFANPFPEIWSTDLLKHFHWVVEIAFHFNS